MSVSEKKEAVKKLAKLPPEVQRRILNQIDGAQIMAEYIDRKEKPHGEDHRD